MINNACEFEKKYPFLKVYKPEHEEHYEVTKEAMSFLHEYYDYYKQNYKGPEKRSQLTSKGWSISRKAPYKDKEKRCINVVGDILTSLSAFPKEKKDADAMAIFEDIYHTVGNFIPIPGGANFRPGRQGKAGNSDHFDYKLNIIKGFFDKEDMITDNEIYQISKRIEIGLSLGSNVRQKKLIDINKTLKIEPKLEVLKDNVQLRYWIQLEWKDEGKKWGDFVEENYLQDFVDESDDLKPVRFNSEDPLDVCKRIIKRGYRITHKGKLDKAEINKIFDHLGVSNISNR
uniref:hypothetical protein n=1 Tax=Ndongobacter massiliensis TaxID=1871025 RepID=UPI000931A60D|nr:hypothetical protein [Ndongobacter massiliensis]